MSTYGAMQSRVACQKPRRRLFSDKSKEDKEFVILNAAYIVLCKSCRVGVQHSW